VPIYEYRCQSCGERVEILVRSGIDDLPTCPNCHSALLEKLLSMPYVMVGEGRPAGQTCCETPPCSGDRPCWR